MLIYTVKCKNSSISIQLKVSQLFTRSLNIKHVIFLPIDRTIANAIPPYQLKSESNGNEGVLHIH